MRVLIEVETEDHALATPERVAQAACVRLVGTFIHAGDSGGPVAAVIGARGFAMPEAVTAVGSLA